jgi:hypothetical protein
MVLNIMASAETVAAIPAAGVFLLISRVGCDWMAAGPGEAIHAKSSTSSSSPDKMVTVAPRRVPQDLG